MQKPIVIIGGGLAGLTLGIGLRQRDVPVVIWEAGTYPRHRVCGEFISGRGQDVLERLNLTPILFGCGARRAATAAFFSSYSSKTAPVRVLPLPQSAICISRDLLDASLAQEFRQLGGVLRLNEHWNQQSDEGIVWASGRKPSTESGGYRWIGIKAHACNVHLKADLETHIGSDGYVGLCRLNGSVTNVCALLRARGPIPDLAKTWQQRLRGEEKSVLRSHMSEAQFIPDTFCATAGFSLAPQQARESPDIRIGDALTMIPPFTGNGMSMAFEAASIAIDPLSDYSHGQLDWAEAHCAIARRIDRTFAGRLQISALLHRALFHHRVARMLISLTSRNPALWHLLFKVTR